MPRMYKISRAGLRLIYKIRHHRGHGIHSPFVFDLVNKVIEEKSQYYAYSDIRRYIGEWPDKTPRISKFNRLSFKLVNHFEAKSVLEIGSGDGTNTLFLTAPFSKSGCVCIEPHTVKRNSATQLYSRWKRPIDVYPDIENAFMQIDNRSIDAVFIDLKRFQEQDLSFDKIGRISNFLHDKSFIVVNNIRSDKKAKSLWSDLIQVNGRTAMLDLFSVGILFFDPKLYRWDYKISY